MVRVRSVIGVLVLVTLLTGACTMPMGGDVAAAPEPVPGQITVANPRARSSPMVEGNGAAYMVVLNGTDAPVRLAGASSAVASAVEMHETVMEEGIMKMIPRLDGFEIAAGGSVELMPGGKHVMLIGLTTPLETGKPFSLTLTFDNGTTLELSVPVVDMTGAGSMGAMEQPEGTGEMPTSEAKP